MSEWISLALNTVDEPLSVEEAQTLERCLRAHRNALDALWEEHHALLDDHIRSRMASGDFVPATHAETFRRGHARQDIIATVVVDEKEFHFDAARYPDLGALRERILAARAAMARDVLEFFDRRDSHG